MTGKDQISIFAYRDYRTFLNDFFEKRLKPKGLSYRSVAKRAKIANPSYLPQILSGKRNLSIDSATKLGKGIGLSSIEVQYLTTLVELERTLRVGEAESVLERLRQISTKKQVEVRYDESIYSSWLHGVTWALAGINGFELTKENVAAKLGGIATPDEIQKSIEFLCASQFLVPTEEGAIFRQKPIAFAPLNDVRRHEIQRNHMRFLDLAKLRVLDPLDDREFQGLTISVSKSKLGLVKERLREFLLSMQDQLSHDQDAEAVMRIQCCAYWVTRDVQR